MFKLSYQELKLLVTQFNTQKDIVTDIHERFVIYEAYERHIANKKFFSIKWIEQTLQLSFPKIHSIVQNLINDGYLTRVQCEDDRRIFLLKPTKKLIQGVSLFEKMKLNELKLLGLTLEGDTKAPNLSDLNLKTKDQIKDKYLDEFTK